MRAAPDRASIAQVDGGPNHATYSGQGHLSVQWREGVVHIVLSGHGQGGFASIVKRHWDDSLRSAPRVTLLADCWDMPTYDSPLRVDLTSWLLRRRAAVAELHVITRSRIVAMGVGVANLALGGLVTHHRTRPTFDSVAARLGIAPAQRT